MKFRMELCRQIALRYGAKMCECFALQHHMNELNEMDEEIKNQETKIATNDPVFWEKRGDKMSVHMITCQKEAENYWQDPRNMDCNHLGLQKILESQLSDDEMAMLMKLVWPSVIRNAMEQYQIFAQSNQGFYYERAARLRHGGSVDDRGYEDTLFPR